MIRYSEDLEKVIGWGINQVGACGRDGSLYSYDYTFETEEEANEFYETQIECGYGNRYYSPQPVTDYENFKAIGGKVFMRLRGVR